MVKVVFKLKNLLKLRLRLVKGIFISFLMIILPVSLTLSCVDTSLLNGSLMNKEDKMIIQITLNDPIFDSLERKWISSDYFDRGFNYENTRLQVISLYDVLKKKNTDKSLDAIILNCADDYQGVISINDIKKYDLQIALKIKLSQGADRPEWLQPLIIVVPNHASPPFSERFYTANINELRFVKLADYYAPLRFLSYGNPATEIGLDLFKDNCLFCHSINKVGGNKGTSLFAQFNFGLDNEQDRFKERFIEIHGVDSNNKQNMAQFLVDDQFDLLLEFLHEIALTKKIYNYN
jgi:hypothetical protein